MKKLLLFASLLALPLVFMAATSGRDSEQDSGQDVFTPIGKYIQSGDYDKLSAWFADNLELDMLGAVNNCTRNQAKLIMKNFFAKYTPKKFSVIHKSGKAPMKYAVGSLSAGGERFRVILYVKSTGTQSHIEQLKVERE
ncbi:MAG: DUF4783 domain-containing protein [Bacteroidales bacterium]|nr:DUF4783 domain-containing protein [Bacteroidales bacterium]